MKFALLGYSDAVCGLIQQLLSASDHSLVAIARVADHGTNVADHGAILAAENHREANDANAFDPPPALLSTLFSTVPHTPWESLLAGGDDIDAVIVGDANRSDHQEPLRKLTQAGLPLIISYPSCDVIMAFELEMIRRDVGGILLPYFAGIHALAFATLAGCCPHGDGVSSDTSSDTTDDRVAPWGRIQQVAMRRHCKSTSRPLVERQLAQDAYWLRKLLGPYDRLGAFGPQSDANFANLSVHLSTNQVPVQWSVLSESDPSPTTLAVIGNDNTAQITLDETTRSWALHLTRHDDPPPRVDVGKNSDLAEIVALLRDPTGGACEWEYACRALELVETVDRSLRRGKTIDLHNEEATEENTFKSLMAAGGCGALLLALAAFLLMAIIETLEIPLLEADFFHHWPGRLFYWHHWPIYLVGTLALFLALQLFKLVFPTGDRSD